jgi:hypothetical protein
VVGGGERCHGGPKVSAALRRKYSREEGEMKRVGWNSEAERFSRTPVRGRSKRADGTAKQNASAEHRLEEEVRGRMEQRSRMLQQNTG